MSSPVRTNDLQIVKDATDPYADEMLGFDAEDWLADDDNIALTNEQRDVALFAKQHIPHVACGHYFFHSRGKTACIVAKQMLEEIFTGPYGVEIIVGLTPLDKRGALRMNEYLGFKSHGQVETEAGPCEMVILTKKEWNA